MIPIVKGAAPDVLLQRGPAAAQRLKDRYDANALLPADEQKKLNISADLYGHAQVRERLNQTHYGKCAFCEVLIPRPYADAHVEHWRPKGSVRQARADVAAPPGYYWLAYEWDNLLLACLFCNRDNKSTIFPLDNPDQRALDHHHPLAAEIPLLLKPDDGSDPRHDIEFIEEIPRARNQSRRGKVTIEVLGLDRLEHTKRDEMLVELQQAYDDVVRFNADPSPAGQLIVTRARAFYHAAPLPTSPFSAMADAFVAANPLPAPIQHTTP